MVEGHGMGTVYMRLGPEGQSVGAEFRVMSVKSPILSMEKLVAGLKQDLLFSKSPKGIRSVTLDVVKNYLLVVQQNELATMMQDLIAAPHVRLAPLERDEKPIIAMDFRSMVCR